MHRISRRGKLFLLDGVLVIVLGVLLVTLSGLVPFAALRHLGQVAARPTPTPTSIATATVWSDPLTQARLAFTPTHITIPAMHLNAAVIAVGATTDGSMATPHCASATDPLCSEVYWWDGGVVPGQNGNAVMAGHVNRPDASPASFGNLDALVVGNQFTIHTQSGKDLTFVVTKIERVTAYAKGGNNPIINEIFGPAATPNLNLITCIGDWDGATFDQRLVVHTQLVGQSSFPAG
jgi:hypothetical protein